MPLLGLVFYAELALRHCCLDVATNAGPPDGELGSLAALCQSLVTSMNFLQNVCSQYFRNHNSVVIQN